MFNQKRVERRLPRKSTAEEYLAYAFQAIAEIVEDKSLQMTIRYKLHAECEDAQLALAAISSALQQLKNDAHLRMTHSVHIPGRVIKSADSVGASGARWEAVGLLPQKFNCHDSDRPLHAHAEAGGAIYELRSKQEIVEALKRGMVVVHQHRGRTYHYQLGPNDQLTTNCPGYPPGPTPSELQEAREIEEQYRGMDHD